MTEDRPRLVVPAHLWGYLRRRWYYLIIAVVLIVAVLVLLAVAEPLADFGRSLSLNLAADLIGSIVVLFVIAPFLARGDLRQDAVLNRFDHTAFIRQTADARHRVHILELWTDLLEGNFRSPFLRALSDALEGEAKVRILLLDPDARAAEQRADDLRRRTSVVENILGNLRELHEFVTGLPERSRANIEVRVYSALPPVQMYLVDDRALVSFYPVNTTSWNGAQYQTSPSTQLGTFVGDKFEELWKADTTRTLEQFQTIAITVAANGFDHCYRVSFVVYREHFFVGGQEIVAGHAETGVGGLQARVDEDNANGEQEVRGGPYRMVLADPEAADTRTARELFDAKYGPEGHDLLIKLETVRP